MALFIFVPLRFSAVGRQKESKPAPVLAYFACLGCGFIMIELVLIQKFMQMIGSPLYTYSTVIFVLLMASGLGSLMSERVAPAGTGRWRLPFAAVVATVIGFTLLQPWIFNFGLQFPLMGRILVAALAIFPIGFFLGMPFPLGILAIASRPPGAVAWAWGMNGAFTVIGGVLSVFLSVAFGFSVTLVVAAAVYVLAAFVYRSLSPAPQAAASVEGAVLSPEGAAR
jgi:predicted membrane-bound spermidine synthase